jgi:hypothetical protein
MEDQQAQHPPNYNRNQDRDRDRDRNHCREEMHRRVRRDQQDRPNRKPWLLPSPEPEPGLEP